MKRIIYQDERVAFKYGFLKITINLEEENHE